MAKTNRPQPTRTTRRPSTARPPATAAPPLANYEVLTPQRVCELLARPGPLDPPPAPPPEPGFLTWWDPGLSVRDWKRARPDLFPAWLDWYHDLPFAGRFGLAGWRRMRPDPVAVGKPFAEQAVLADGEEIASAREAVTFHLLRFLAAGERRADRVRVAEVLDSGRRVLVGPFRTSGLELVNYSDRWACPVTGLAVAVTPVG